MTTVTAIANINYGSYDLFDRIDTALPPELATGRYMSLITNLDGAIVGLANVMLNRADSRVRQASGVDGFNEMLADMDQEAQREWAYGQMGLDYTSPRAEIAKMLALRLDLIQRVKVNMPNYTAATFSETVDRMARPMSVNADDVKELVEYFKMAEMEGIDENIARQGLMEDKRRDAERLERNKSGILGLIDNIEPDQGTHSEKAGHLPVDFADLPIERQKRLINACIRSIDRGAQNTITRVRGLEKFTSLSLLAGLRKELVAVLKSPRFAGEAATI